MRSDTDAISAARSNISRTLADRVFTKGILRRRVSILRATFLPELCQEKSTISILFRAGRADLLKEPGLGESKMTIGRANGNVERFGGLLDRQAGKVPELDDLGGHRFGV